MPCGGTPNPRRESDFEERIEDDFNETLPRAISRPISAPSEDDADFDRDLPTSVLPLIMELSSQHELPVCFRARAAPARQQSAAAAIARAAALHRRLPRLGRIAGRAVSTTTPAIPR